MSRDLDAMASLAALLPRPGEEEPCFRQADLTPVESLALAGRGLAVTSAVLDGVAHDFDRAKPLVRGVAFLGRLVVGVARILTPGGLEGTIYRHWMSIAVLVDLVLFLIATLVPGSVHVAFLATGYTVAALLVVETTRYVAQRRQGLKNRLYAAGAMLLGLAVLFGALYFAGNAILGGALTASSDGKLPSAPKDLGEFWTQFTANRFRLSRFAFGTAVFLFASLVWGQVVARSWTQERGRIAFQRTANTAIPCLALALGTAVTAFALLRDDPDTQAAWNHYAFLALATGLALAAITFVESTIRTRLRRKAFDAVASGRTDSFFPKG